VEVGDVVHEPAPDSSRGAVDDRQRNERFGVEDVGFRRDGQHGLTPRSGPADVRRDLDDATKRWEE
jgi:hypothetical protein